jgi:hypothetical protein
MYISHFFSSLAYSEKHNQLLAHFTSVKKSYLYIHIKVIDAMLEAKGKKKKKTNPKLVCQPSMIVFLPI